MVNPVEFWPASNVEIDRFKHNLTDNRKKVVVVEVKGILKVDSEYCHGMHVTEIISPIDTLQSGSSDPSTGSLSASARSGKTPASSFTNSYDIWRTWEECLIFQGVLERRYKDLAKAKRSSLRKETSRNVKSHTQSESGIYASGTSASSFASLPTNTDPRMIVKDVHHIVPKLTIKQGLFYTSPADVAKQADQLIPFINSLWGEDLIEEDLPKLFLQLKEDDEVREFFSFRASDRDIALKHGLQSNPELKRTRGLRRSVSSFTDSDSQSIASFATSSSSSSDSSSGTRRRSLFSMRRRAPENLPISRVNNAEQQVDRVSVYNSEYQGDSETRRWRDITSTIVEDPYEEEGELQVKDGTENIVHTRFSLPLPEIYEDPMSSVFDPYSTQERRADVPETVSILSGTDLPGDHTLADPHFDNKFFKNTKNDDSIMTNYSLSHTANDTIPESYEAFRPSVAAAEEYESEAETPTLPLFMSSTVKSQHYRQTSSASTITECRDSDDDADSLMKAFAFASINSSIKAPDSRPVSIVSYTSTGSIRDLGSPSDAV